MGVLARKTGARMVAGVLAVVGVGCAESDYRGQPLAEPPVVQSADGVLKAELTASWEPIPFAGHTNVTQVYNSRFAPPTLSLDPGDTIELTLRNELTKNTNLHYHGMNVSPLPNERGNGDDVFLTVEPGASTFYSIDVPEGHPPGMYYYHPQSHGLTESQIGGGMSGAILVGGLLDPFPQLAEIESHLLLLKDLQVGADGHVTDPPDTVNVPWRDCIPKDGAPGECETIDEDDQSFPIYTRESGSVCDDGQLPRGQVKVIIPFTDPVIAGKFVYHCHIGEHEDNGMMATIEVCNDENVPCPDEAAGSAW